MGRSEWYFNWGTKSSSKIKGAAAGGAGKAPPVAAAGGCMNGALDMFDLHQFHLCFAHHHTPPRGNTGVEAPRNSLESLEDMAHNELPSLASIIKQEKIDLASRRDTKLKLQVQAPRNKAEEVSSSETNSSPAGVRTPNLVARLMGLDTLPQSTNTTPRSSTCQNHPIRSPHVSSSPPARRAKTGLSDSKSQTRSTSSVRRKQSASIIDEHRLSLQMNKENSIVKEMEWSRPSCSGISSTRKREGKSSYYEEECKSPGYYARQKMRQVKESVSRRFGADISNTIDKKDKDIRRDEHLLSSNKPKKGRRRNNNRMKMMSDCYELELKDEKIKSNVGEKVSLLKGLDLNRNKKDDRFIIGVISNDGSLSNKKCSKRMPLSSDLFHASIMPSLVPFQKDSPFCPSPSKLLHNKGVLAKAKPFKDQTNINASINTSTSTSTRTRTMAWLSKIPSQRYMQQKVMHKPADQGDKRSNKDANSILEFQYISRILKCIGIDKNTPLSLARWFSPTHPLDPSIFHILETTHYLNLNDPSSPHQHKGHACFNRKLIFHLVDEILADLLKPYNKNKPWALTYQGQNSHYTYQQQQLLQINGFQLVKTLCTRIRSLNPISANYQNLQDIDALVVKNMPKFGLQAIEEEGEAIVFEIERDIVSSLVQEVAMLSLVDNHIRSMRKYISTIRI